ncbi:hypothetical protein Tco_0468430 [Tanacetum coccineum]
MQEFHKLLTDQVDDTILRYNVSKPLPLGGKPGYVTIQPDFFFNKDMKYLRYGRKVGRPALSISKMKAAYYLDVGLEQLVPDQFWIEEESKDFQLGIESYQTQLNLTKPRWDATGFEFKHDYTVIDSPRAVTFRDRYGVQMIMRFNEIHKFSDGTLQQIDEALDYRVKEFRVNRTNPGMNTRFWTKKDVVRSKEFMFAIQKRLKTRRIFRNLESFVGGRIREGDYRSYKDGKVRYSFPRSRQNRRDLPRDNSLVSVEVLRIKEKMELETPVQWSQFTTNVFYSKLMIQDDQEIKMKVDLKGKLKGSAQCPREVSKVYYIQSKDIKIDESKTSSYRQQGEVMGRTSLSNSKLSGNLKGYAHLHIKSDPIEKP